MKAELRFDVMEKSGELCVIISGVCRMRVWYADNWDCLLDVRTLSCTATPPTYHAPPISPQAVASRSNASLGPGSGPILLDDVECTGSEESLTFCGHSTIVSCAYRENVGVTCHRGELYMRLHRIIDSPMPL